MISDQPSQQHDFPSKREQSKEKSLEISHTYNNSDLPMSNFNGQTQLLTMDYITEK